jgi:succinyl-CoA synthetase beta subunit
LGGLKPDVPNSLEEHLQPITNALKLPQSFLPNLIQTFNTHHFTFLEINPLVVISGKTPPSPLFTKEGEKEPLAISKAERKTKKSSPRFAKEGVRGSSIHLLDLAVEVDTAGAFFVHHHWTKADFVTGSLKQKTSQEKTIENLANQSQASLTFNLINPNGAIWVLLSGGGASIALADEAYNLGHGDQLANYGEYSGNPNDEETYIYTKNVLALMLQSKAKKKVLIIGGGVANFTDIKKTFAGIIRSLDEVKDKLAQQHLKVYVRRGGPNQDAGLKHMADFLKSADLYGHVSGPDMPLTDIVQEALKYLAK